MLKWMFLGVAAAIVVMQFAAPRPNVSVTPPGPNDFIVRYHPPEAVRQILLEACYDCHSDNTRYPWYAHAQPVGWWLAEHIEDGKRHLNFSQFGAYPAKRQAKALDHMADEVTNRTMPLRSYTWIHHDARLTDAQVDALSAWIDSVYDRIAPEPSGP